MTVTDQKDAETHK